MLFSCCALVWLDHPAHSYPRFALRCSDPFVCGKTGSPDDDPRSNSDVYLRCGIWILGGGTPSLLAPTKELVTIGPYRYVRNPIQIGQGIFFIGLGLYLQSPAVLLFSAAWLLFCHLYVVLIEEGSLKKKFGEAYEEYCRAVPRWIPSARLREKNR